jgi:hypothetical protein
MIDENRKNKKWFVGFQIYIHVQFVPSYHVLIFRTSGPQSDKVGATTEDQKTGIASGNVSMLILVLHYSIPY